MDAFDLTGFTKNPEFSESNAVPEAFKIIEFAD